MPTPGIRDGDRDDSRRRGAASSSATLRAPTVTVPPSGIASRALMTRLTSAISSSATSTLTGQTSSVDVEVRAGRCRRRRLSSTSRIASMRSATSIACGLTLCRRAKVSSWRVSAAPRWAAVSIAEQRALRLGSSSAPFFSMWMLPLMIISRLLKSCATPPVSWPSASIFCDFGELLLHLPRA